MSTVIITGSTTLRVLNVGGNEIGDDGISMISEELQHNNSLTELNVINCGFSAKGQSKNKIQNFIVMITTGAIAISKILMGNCTLQVLNVSDNSIGDDGISVIVEQLQHITTLTELRVVLKCGLTVKGTIVCIKCIIISPDSEDYLTISLDIHMV